MHEVLLPVVGLLVVVLPRDVEFRLDRTGEGGQFEELVPQLQRDLARQHVLDLDPAVLLVERHLVRTDIDGVVEGSRSLRHARHLDSSVAPGRRLPTGRSVASR